MVSAANTESGKGAARKGRQPRRVAGYEGDPFARLAIEGALRQAGAEPVGIADEGLDGAARALGQHSVEIVGPIVAELKRRGVRYVLYAGQPRADLDGLRRLWPGEKVLARPAPLANVAEAVMALFRDPLPGQGEAA